MEIIETNKEPFCPWPLGFSLHPVRTYVPWGNKLSSGRPYYKLIPRPWHAHISKIPNPSMSLQTKPSKRRKDANESENDILKNTNIGFIGSGNMARALIRGIIGSPGASNAIQTLGIRIMHPLYLGGDYFKKNIYTSCTKSSSGNYQQMQVWVN